MPQGCERMPESCKLQGCVSDKKTDPGNHLVFWNGEHNADQNSSDPKIRRVCRGKEETPEKRKLDCNKSFLIWNFGSMKLSFIATRKTNKTKMRSYIRSTNIFQSI